MQTSVHIRLNNATGQRFIKKLQEMGYSVMPNDKRSYFMHNPSDGRVLIEEEPSSDFVIKQFLPKTPESEIVDLLEKTARAGKGDYYIDENANGDEVSIVQGVDAPQPQHAAPAPAQQPIQQNPNMQPQYPQQPAPNANMDPEFYKKIMLDAMGSLMKMFALGHLKPEDIYTQATRLQSATWITAGLTGGFLDASDVTQVMADTKNAIQRIPQEIQNAIQGFQQKQQAAQQQAAQAAHSNNVTYAPPSGQPMQNPALGTDDTFDPGF